MKQWILVFAALVMAGCEAVTTTALVGDEPVDLKAKDWDGTWVTADGEVVIVKVTDDDEGRANIYWLESEDGQPVLKSSEIIVREVNDWQLVNSPVPADERNDEEVPEYVFARIATNDDELFVWTPKVDAFKEAADEDHFIGELTASGLQLGPLSEAHLDYLTGEAGLRLFDLERPISLRRIKAD